MACANRRAQNWPGCRFLDREKPPSGGVSPKKVNRDCQRALQPSKQGHTSWEGARRPNVLVQHTMEHGIPFHASGDWPQGLNKCAIANALARLWTARLPDFTCRSQPAARFCLFGGVMQHPTTSRANSDGRRSTQRLGIGDVHARLIKSRNSICIVSWGRHGTGTWGYYSSLRASWGGSLRRHVRDMATPHAQGDQVGAQTTRGAEFHSPNTLRHNSLLLWTFYDPLCCPGPTGMHNATRAQR
jgi:hypothetical protein